MGCAYQIALSSKTFGVAQSVDTHSEHKLKETQAVLHRETLVYLPGHNHGANKTISNTKGSKAEYNSKATFLSGSNMFHTRAC